MPVTTREGLLEAWATQLETMEQKLEALYGPPQDTPTLPSVTTREGMLEAIETESKKAYVNYAKVYGAYHSNTYAYKLTLPSNLMDWYGVKKVGGGSIVFNQIAGFTASTTTSKGVTATFTTTGIGTFSGTATGGDSDMSKQSTNAFVSGHVYLLRGCPPNGSNTTYYISVNEGKEYGDGLVFTCSTGGKRYIHHVIKEGVNSDGLVFRDQYFDLTKMFGAGNEPTSVAELNAMLPAEYYDVSANKLMNVGVTDIVFMDGDIIKETYSVPAEVQALDGYGMSCPAGTNYIDFEEKKFYQYVGTRAYASGDDTDVTVITDGTNTNYKLDAVVETDISAYITDVPNADVQSGWDIIFHYDDDYHVPVPVQVDYIGV